MKEEKERERRREYPESEIEERRDNWTWNNSGEGFRRRGRGPGEATVALFRRRGVPGRFWSGEKRIKKNRIKCETEIKKKK